jgi:ABC-type glycerol-3-phosphate transport system permease component
VTVQSLKTAEEDVFGSALYVVHPTFANYRALLEDPGARVRGYVIVPRVPFVIWLGNSLSVLGGTLVVILLSSILAAYGLGRLKLPGWRWCRRAPFASYVMPQTILFIPMYQVMSRLGLDDNHLALMLIYSTMALPFCVWILSSYYGTLPREIEESAPVEGASPATAFLQIMLPMSRNILVAAGLFPLGTVGNDFMLASIFLLDPAKQTVAAGLRVMEVSLEELVAGAGVNLAVIPLGLER